MVCPVCGKKSQYIVCPDCGFDSSRDCEKYPTLAPIGKTPSVSALQKEWKTRQKSEEEPKKKRPWLALIACAAALILGIGIGAGLGGGKATPTEPSENVQMQAPPETVSEQTHPETTEPTVPVTYKPGEEPWRGNVLRRDEVPAYDFVHITAAYVVDFPVFGSEYLRKQISSVTFLDTLSDAPENAWDVSESGDGKVLAWVIPNGELYDLYIGAEGGIWATEACKELFAGYSNVKQIHNMNFLHTEDAQDMCGMFIWCFSLSGLDLSNFDTADVHDMRDMFYCCESLTSLDLSSFDTSNVQNMNGMFSSCESLTSLDLSSLDTSKVTDMSRMFASCKSLTSLDLSSFDTSNVQNMNRMFSWCESLTSLDLSSFDTSNVVDTYYMFYSCPAGSAWQHLQK